MKHPLNIPMLLDEIAGYIKAEQIIVGVSEPHRGAVARRLIDGLAATPRTSFDRGYRLRLDEIARTTPSA